ncbi:unnamed protein product [Adineta ricciae]|uniref:Uncharacterized protein n=1 Tax=Adineta ricciae TaxID=249248 RepID=A0A814TB32_ADIRI|nr:unnamed protein product [Adineta ricciae]CAF1317234.1 unnamed protein product [Adineta ricciae]
MKTIFMRRTLYWSVRTYTYVFILVIILIFILWTDVSLKPSSSCQQVNIYGKINEKRCYPLLVNFADECCAQSQEDNCATGLRFGIKQCVRLTMNIFNKDKIFIRRNREILSYRRGAGFWIWKAYILWHELYVAREGDIIVYSDSAVHFIADIDLLVTLMKKQDILVFKQTNHSECAYTKRDAFILLNADTPEYVHSMASVASYIIVRKSIDSFLFVSEWLTYSQDNRALTDEPNILGKANYDEFITHRHDQSILGILAKKWRLRMYTDPSQFGENYSRPFPTIFWHHRSKD